MINTENILKSAEELGLKTFQDLVLARELSGELEKSTKFNEKMALVFSGSQNFKEKCDEL